MDCELMRTLAHDGAPYQVHSPAATEGSDKLQHNPYRLRYGLEL